jgi:probable rRNA maturation factor
MAAINFFSEEISFSLTHPRKTTTWIKRAILKEGYQLGSLSVIFCGDLFLLSLNAKYLNHHTLTDVITFDQSIALREISGEIYISVERVKENASAFKTEFDSELHRVIIHGVLHLIGYADKKTSEKARIRKKEEAYLSLRK